MAANDDLLAEFDALNNGNDLMAEFDALNGEQEKDEETATPSPSAEPEPKVEDRMSFSDVPRGFSSTVDAANYAVEELNRLDAEEPKFNRKTVQRSRMAPGGHVSTYGATPTMEWYDADTVESITFPGKKKEGPYATDEVDEGTTVKVGDLVGVGDRLYSFSGDDEKGHPLFKRLTEEEAQGKAANATMDGDVFRRMRGQGRIKMDASALEQVRQGVLAETGREDVYGEGAMGTLNAVLTRALPYIGRGNADRYKWQLQKLDQMANGNFDGMDYISLYKSDIFDDENVDVIRKQDESEEDWQKRMQAAAKAELGKRVKAMQETEEDIGTTNTDSWDKILKGFVDSSGYALEFAVPGGTVGKMAKGWKLVGGTGRIANLANSAVRANIVSAPVTLAEASSRYTEMRTPGFALDQNGNPYIRDMADSSGIAALKAIGGALYDTNVEMGLEPVMMGMYRAGKRSVGMMFDRFTPQLMEGLGKNYGRFVHSDAGRLTRDFCKAWGEFRDVTHIDSPFGEQLEENAQNIEKLFHLDGKESEYKGFAEEWKQFKNDTFSTEKQLDIFLGLIGQMLVGSAVSAYKTHQYRKSDAYQDELKQRRNLEGVLRLANVDEDTISSLSDEQMAVLEEMWQRYSANPEELKEKCRGMGLALRAASQDMAYRTGVRFRENLESRGVEAENFKFSTDESGKPKFQQIVRITPDGKSTPMNAMSDKGVTIVDNGDGSFSVMNDWRGSVPVQCDSFDAAHTQADTFVAENQARNLDNAQKAEYLEKYVAPNYKGRNVNVVQTVAQLRNEVLSAIASGEGYFGTESADAIFDENGELHERNAGGFHTKDGTTVLILDNIVSPADMERVMAHEAVGHEGVEQEVGRDNIVEFIGDMRANSFAEFSQNVLRRRALSYLRGGLSTQDALRLAIAECDSARGRKEIMANYAMKRRHLPTAEEWKQHEENEKRRAAGEEVPTDDADLEVLLYNAEQKAKQGDKTPTKAGPMDIRDIEVDETKSEEAEDSETSETKDETAPVDGSITDPDVLEDGRTDAIAIVSRISGAKYGEDNRQIPGEWNKRETMLDVKDPMIQEELDRIIDAPTEEKFKDRLSQYPFGITANAWIKAERIKRHPEFYGEKSTTAEPEGKSYKAAYEEIDSKAMLKENKQLLLDNATEDDFKRLVELRQKAWDSSEEKDFAAFFDAEEEIVKRIKDEQAKASKAAGVETMERVSDLKSYIEAKPDLTEAERTSLNDAVVKVANADDMMQLGGGNRMVDTLLRHGALMLIKPNKTDKSDKHVPNFKLDVNPNTGIKEPLSGKWMPSLAGFGVVWMKEDGTLVQGTGRHRSNKADEADAPMWNVVLREKDGWTKEKISLIDGTFNIKDGKGSIADYVRFYEDSGFKREDAEENGLLSGKGLDAWSIYADATPATRDATDINGTGEEGKITVEQAAVISGAAPKDGDKRNAAIQAALVRAAKTGRIRGPKFVSYCKEMANQMRNGKIGENLLVGEQMDLFADESFLAMEKLAEARSEYRAKKYNEYLELARSIRSAVNNGERLNITDEFAKELGITDKKDKEQLKKALETAQDKADYWNPSGDRILDTADVEKMDDEINAKADKKASKLAEIKAKAEAVKAGKPLPKKPTVKKVDVAKTATTTPATTEEKSEVEKPAKVEHKVLQGADKAFDGLTEAQRDYFDKQVSITDENVKTIDVLEDGSIKFTTGDGFALVIHKDGSASGGFMEGKPSKQSAKSAPKAERKRTVTMKNAAEEKRVKGLLDEIDFDSPELDDLKRAKQTALSGGTSRNQNPSGNEYGKKWKIFKPGTRNVDIGAGRFNKATEFLADLGVTNLAFDPVNRSREENMAAAESVRENPADTATVHNVLNVIDNDDVVDGIINQAARAIKKDGWAIFTIYEGNRSGNPTPTRDGYQRNAKASSYVPRISKYFGQVETHGNVITARKPKDVGTAFWAFDSKFVDGIDFMSEEFDYEKFGKLVTGVGKLVDALVENGHSTFGSLARYISEADAAKYEKAKPVLQDVWNAIAKQKKLVRVSDDEAEKVFGIIDKEAANGNLGESGSADAVGDRALGGEQSAQGAPAPVGTETRRDGASGSEVGAGNDVQGGAELPGSGVGDRTGGNTDRGGADNQSRDGSAGEGTRATSGEGGVSAERASGEGSADNQAELGTAGRGDTRDGGTSSGETAVGVESKPKVVKKSTKAADETKVSPKRHDFKMTKAVEDAILEPNQIKRVQNNIAAIRLIQQLALRDFDATPEEQETLAKYVGWGGLSGVFDHNYDRADSYEESGDHETALHYAKKASLGIKGYELHREIKGLLDDDAYNSARASTTTAFYTPIEMVRAEHAALRALGLNGGRFLGPSAGVGNYASASGEYQNAVNWQFVEKDITSGMILKALFPNQRVNIMGYEETKFPDGFFDLAIDNVPYADVAITDKGLSSNRMMIHDYFFAKTLSKLRPGGVMMFLTSTGTLDKGSGTLRKFLNEHGGKIIGAVRMPNGFFSQNANTEAAADLVIVQKVEGEADNSAFEKQHPFDYEEERRWDKKKREWVTDKKPLSYNGYFADHPEQVIGKMEAVNGQFGKTLNFTMPEGTKEEMFKSIREAIDRALAGVDKDALVKTATVAEKPTHTPIYDEEGLRQGNITMKDGKAYIKSGDMLEPICLPTDPKLPNGTANKGYTQIAKELKRRGRLPSRLVECVISLRKALRDVVDAEMRGCTDEELKPLLDALNAEYDTFKAKYGSLHDKTIMPFVMLDKADGNRMLALEKIGRDNTVSKADIFTKRVISLGARATKADTPKEALIICYSENGVIVPERVGELLGVSAEEAVQQLKDSGDAFENPQTGRLEPSWEYLSGHVRAKHAAALAAVESGDASFRKNAEALEKVLPPMVKLEDVEIKFGAPWCDPEVMKDFLRESFGSDRMYITLEKSEITGAWNFDASGSFGESPWGSTTWNPYTFISRVLNNESMESWHTDPVTKDRWRDEQETEANKLAAEKLHSSFAQYIRESEKWADSCFKRYNEVNNDNVAISLPNNIMPFKAAGMSEDAMRKMFEDGDPNRPKKGREYQSQVIARGVLGGTSLCLAHCVGAGKTMEMQAIGMLGRHLGMFKKAMYVVPNHMLNQFCNEFIEAFPNANILKMTADDVKPENRRAFFAQVANGDWDAIVVKHSTFSMKLGMSTAYQKAFAEREMKNLELAIEELREQGDRISVKKAEKMKASLEQKLKDLQNTEGKDAEIVSFEELGVDQLFVDEAHNFKGLPIQTKNGRVKGLGSSDSQRAIDMQMKCDYVQSLHNGDRGVVFATGTPLSNAPAVESFVFLRYLAPKLLREQGLNHFDDFINTFGKITTESELNLDGKTAKEVDRISSWSNIPELMSMFKSRVDIVNSEQLDIPRPKPKYHMIDVDMTPAQERIMETVARECVKPGGKEWPAKGLDLSAVAKYACISPRLLGFTDGGNKIPRLVGEVKKVYDETSDKKGAQLIFTDIFNSGRESTVGRIINREEVGPSSGMSYNLNDEIKAMLVQQGIPESEIAIMQDLDKQKGDKDDNKEALFTKVRSGEVRVLIGSRPRMGEGTNVQKHLAAIHLVHPGWKPSEDDQAIGRIIRFGNEYTEGHVYYYMTKGNANVGSYETKNHQLIGKKSELIKMVMRGDTSIRSIDLDENEMDRDMLMGLSSGNKALMELIDVKKQTRKMELNTSSTIQSAARMKDRSEANGRQLEREREEWAETKNGIQRWLDANKDKEFTFTSTDGTVMDKAKDISGYVANEVAKGLTMDSFERYRHPVWSIGNINGIDVILAWNEETKKFSIAVKDLGVAREIGNVGFVADFTPAMFTAFKTALVRTADPDYIKNTEANFADREKVVRKQAADAEKLAKEAEQMKSDLIAMRRRQAELERAVTPMMVKTTEDHGVSAYGNWLVRKDGAKVVAQNTKTYKRLEATSVKAIIPMIDNEDFGDSGNAATKTIDIPVQYLGKDRQFSEVGVGDVDFMSPEFDVRVPFEFNVFGPSGKEYHKTLAKSSAKAIQNVKFQYLFPDGMEKGHRLTYRERMLLGQLDVEPISVNRARPKNGIILDSPEKKKWFYDLIKRNFNADGSRRTNGGAPVVSRSDAKGSVGLGGIGGVGGGSAADRNMVGTASASGTAGNPVNADRGADTGRTSASQMTFSDLGVDFMSEELNDTEKSYAESEDKTPTEEVSKAVFGMTNDDIAVEMRAAKLEPPIHEKKSDETMRQQAEVLLSRPEYMAKLSRAVYKVGRPLRDYETIALGELFYVRQQKVNDLQSILDDLKSIPDDQAASDPEYAQMLKQTKDDLKEAKALLYETGIAKRQGASEQGRALRSNRMKLDKNDLSFAGISNAIAEAAGGAERITPEMEAKIKGLADDFTQLNEDGQELYSARLKAFSEKIVKEIKSGGKMRQATEAKLGDEGKRVKRNYFDAMAQIEVHANEVGGTLIGLADQMYPSWGRWLKYIGEYHCFMNPDITEEAVIKAITEDVAKFVDGVDENQIRDMLTGFGHNYRQSRYDSQRLMNDLRSQARMKRQLDYMNETNELPPATGMVRDDPSLEARKLAREVQERKKEVDETHGGANRLKGALQSAKTRVKNRIEELEEAINSGEKIERSARTPVEDEELRQLKSRRDSLKGIYDSMFKTENGRTEEQRVKMLEQALSRELERTIEDYARAMAGDFSPRKKPSRVNSLTAETLRQKIAETKDAILELKSAAYEFGLTPEEVAKKHAQKMKAREDAIVRMAERIEKGDIRPNKKPQPPMPPEMQKRYDEMGKQLKKAHQKLADMRLEAENATTPTFWRKGKEYGKFVTAAQRALRATLDFSATMRQAARITLGHPVIGAKSFVKAVRAMKNDANLQAINDEIMSDPNVQEAVGKYGLHIREVDGENARDVEMFHGMERNRIRLFGKDVAITDIPFFGELMLKSERHYLTYLNAVSTELYNAIVNDQTRFPGGATPWQKKMVCDMINMWNGSGALSKERRSAMQKAWVNEVFWAPGLAISRIQTAVGYDIWAPLIAKGVANDKGGYDPVSAGERATMAKIGASEHFKSTLAMIAIGALLKWIFASDDDWYKFGQADWYEKLLMLVSPTVGNTTIDLTGGEGSVYRLIHTLATGEKKSTSGRTQVLGETFGAPTHMQVVQRFMEGKLSPWLSEAAAIIAGRDYTGEEYGIGKAIVDSTIPLTFTDIYDQLDQNGIGKSIITIAATLLGAGGSTYDRKPYENAVNPFAEALKEYESIEKDEALDEDTREELLENIRTSNPLMRDEVREDIAADLKLIRHDEFLARKNEKRDGEPDTMLLEQIEQDKAKLLERIRAARR